jgi:hypothetical protein
MIMMGNTPFDRAMKLAVLSGLKATLGPAFLRTSQRRPEAQYWVAAAIAEMVLDKVGFLPSRSRLPLMIPHAVAGGWVARESLREDGIDDPAGALMGAAVAAGVATFAPMVRGLSRRILGVPDPVLGVAEDYFALKLGTEAVGLSMDDVTHAAKASIEDLGHQLAPAAQSIGAGSM